MFYVYVSRPLNNFKRATYFSCCTKLTEHFNTTTQAQEKTTTAKCIMHIKLNKCAHFKHRTITVVTALRYSKYSVKSSIQMVKKNSVNQ